MEHSYSYFGLGTGLSLGTGLGCGFDTGSDKHKGIAAEHYIADLPTHPDGHQGSAAWQPRDCQKSGYLQVWGLVAALVLMARRLSPWVASSVRVQTTPEDTAADHSLFADNSLLN